MKKILLMMATFFAIGTSYAQRSADQTTEDSNFKPGAGKWLAEANLNPFLGPLGLNSVNQIKVRNFINSNVALRVAATANSIGSVDESNTPYGTTPFKFKDDRKSTTLGLSLGIERHLKGTSRLSPYFGGELSIANKTSKQELTINQSTTTTKGAWVTSDVIPIYNSNGSISGYQQISDIQERGFMSYGLNLISGFDFYIARNFFLGYELNLGFNQYNFSDIELTGSGPSNSSVSDSKSNSFSVGFNSYNGIRIGYTF